MPKVYNMRDKSKYPNAVYIGRGSKYGNPYKIGPDGNRDDVINKFINMVEANQELKEEFIRDLEGKDLLCFCKPKPCHGDYLIKIANQECNLFNM